MPRDSEGVISGKAAVTDSGALMAAVGVAWCVR